MRIYSPLFIALRVIGYSLLMLAMAEVIRFDALYPMEEGFFGEISFTEILQEILLFFLVVFYFLLGKRNKSVQPVANLVALFFLISLIREFNFLFSGWVYPALGVLALAGWLAVRDYKKLNPATRIFFEQPASAWLFSGILATYVFSRLFGRSKFWLLLYSEENYRLAKAAVEEGTELLGYSLILIGAVEFFIAWGTPKKERKK